eukprot:498684-Hanusia_phi.AAC.1
MSMMSMMRMRMMSMMMMMMMSMMMMMMIKMMMMMRMGRVSPKPSGDQMMSRDASTEMMSCTVQVVGTGGILNLDTAMRH